MPSTRPILDGGFSADTLERISTQCYDDDESAAFPVAVVVLAHVTGSIANDLRDRPVDTDESRQLGHPSSHQSDRAWRQCRRGAAATWRSECRSCRMRSWYGGRVDQSGLVSLLEDNLLRDEGCSNRRHLSGWYERGAGQTRIRRREPPGERQGRGRAAPTQTGPHARPV